MNIISNLNDETLEELENHILTIDKLDELFEEKLPREIVELIYDMADPICKSCSNCCSICSIYCFYFECLRDIGGRDVCNLPECNRELQKYLITPHIITDTNDEEENKEEEKQEEEKTPLIS